MKKCNKIANVCLTRNRVSNASENAYKLKSNKIDVEDDNDNVHEVYVMGTPGGLFLKTFEDYDRGPVVFNNRLSPWDLQDRRFVKLFRLTKPLARDLCYELEPRLPVAHRSSAIPSDIRYRYPGTIGAIDGTHVAITSPPKNDPEHPEHIIYVNRKNFHSINTQIISDSERKILSIWARFPGSSHDAFIWHQSHVKRHLTRLYHQGLRNTWLIGDSGYGLEPFLMKPFENAREGSPEDQFNRSLKRARASVECTIGLLKNRFRCLLKARTLHYYPPVAAKIINCCAALHNLCIDNNVPLIINNANLINDEIVPDDVEPIINYERAVAIRNRIVQTYF
ncbi:putative nuclease HARBI1 [Macrosteles quadrilineatus]|uniref:putative nuclease HARBI1 n=1 Tax=Macrosteles quadrilineatus TaxID=74068 RepID=UPI0023E2A1E7|nr:putative nuclease HARBI1 [Macrosteles quadrilineatus]